MSNVEKKLMVRCIRQGSVAFSDGEDWRKTLKAPAVFYCLDYYRIDLNDKKGKETENDGSVPVEQYREPLQRYCESLLDEIRGPGNLIYLASCIYSIPLIKWYQYDNIPESLPYPFTGEAVRRLTEMSYIRLDEEPKWHRSGSRLDKTPFWIKSSVVPPNFYCAALLGTIYGLRSGDLKTACYFNPANNTWINSNATPPSHLHECDVAKNMIPDPINGRILVQLEGVAFQPGIYAWHPLIQGEQAWVCLEEPFGNYLWTCGTTLVYLDNKSLLFFFTIQYRKYNPDLFKVWSLEDRCFFQIQFSNEFPKSELELAHKSSMCYLGDDELCLSLSSPDHIALLVFKFKLSSDSMGAQRKGKGKAAIDDDESPEYIMTFTLVSHKTYCSLGTESVVDITLLG